MGERHELAWHVACEHCPYKIGPLGYLKAHRMADAHQRHRHHTVHVLYSKD